MNKRRVSALEYEVVCAMRQYRKTATKAVFMQRATEPFVVFGIPYPIERQKAFAWEAATSARQRVDELVREVCRIDVDELLRERA